MSKNILKKPLTWLILSAAAFVLILSLWAQTYSPCCVSGDSMSPTYKDGDIVSTTKFSDISDLSIGDIIVFKADNALLIKRVEGLPGDSIVIENGYLYRNGIKVEEPFPGMDSSGLFESPVIIPENELFVLGDNRNYSKDSRIIGTISTSEIIGIVNRRLLSL